jgi:hypothetical protein
LELLAFLICVSYNGSMMTGNEFYSIDDYQEAPDFFVLVRESQYEGDSRVSIETLLISSDLEEIENAKFSFENRGFRIFGAPNEVYHITPVFNKKNRMKIDFHLRFQ